MNIDEYLQTRKNLSPTIAKAGGNVERERTWKRCPYLYLWHSLLHYNKEEKAHILFRTDKTVILIRAYRKEVNEIPGWLGGSSPL